MSTIFSSLRWFVFLALLAFGARFTPVATPGPQEDPATETVERDEAVELLRRLEVAHAKIEAFSSPLTYRKEYALEGDFETRIGEVAMHGHGADRQIILVFDRIIDASGHGTDQLRYHLYKDGWWTEVDPARKRVVSRQIQEPGSDRDPFDLGEGPLPLPIGQKADRVLRRFEASIGTPPEDPVLRAIKDPLVLHLVPRAGTPASEDIASIDLLYDRTSLLPLGLLIVDDNDDRTTAWMRTPRSDVDGDAFDGRAGEAVSLIERAEEDPAWTNDRKPLPASPPTEAAP